MHNAIARAWPTTNFSRIYNLVTAVSRRKEGSNSSKLRSPHEIDSPIFIARHVPFSSLFYGSPGTLEEYIWPRYLFPSFLLLLNIILILVNTCLYIRIYDEKNLKKKEKSNRNTQIERVVKFLLEIERLSLSFSLVNPLVAVLLRFPAWTYVKISHLFVDRWHRKSSVTKETEAVCMASKNARISTHL